MTCIVQGHPFHIQFWLSVSFMTKGVVTLPEFHILSTQIFDFLKLCFLIQTNSFKNRIIIIKSVKSNEIIVSKCNYYR